MAKKASSTIALEIEKFEKKIKEYQTYLQLMDITKMTEEESRHKEIGTQNSIMNLLPNWLEALKKLRDVAETKEMETRGNVGVPDAWSSLNKIK